MLSSQVVKMTKYLGQIHHRFLIIILEAFFYFVNETSHFITINKLRLHYVIFSGGKVNID